MTEPIDGFFDQLSDRGQGSLLHRATGSLRIDLQDDGATQRWFVTIDEGDVSVSHRNGRADCVVRTSREVFEGLVGGQVNAFAATLRGVLAIEGDPTLLVLFQRAFPGPPTLTPKHTATPGGDRS